MIGSLPLWQRRTLAVTIALALLMVIWSVLIWPPLAAVESHRQWRETALQSLARYRTLAARRSEFTAARERLAADPGWQKFYAGEGALTQFQNDLGGFYDPQKVTVQALEPLQPVAEKGLKRIGLRFAFTGDIEQLANFLGRTATAPRLILVDSMTISGPQYQESGKNAPLTVRMDLYAYLQPEAGS